MSEIKNYAGKVGKHRQLYTENKQIPSYCDSIQSYAFGCDLR